MRIEVKLGGELKRYGDTGAIEPEAPITVAEAMTRIGVQEEPDEVLVIVNDQVVPPSERGQRTLEDNDQLTLIPQLKGG